MESKGRFKVPTCHGHERFLKLWGIPMMSWLVRASVLPIPGGKQARVIFTLGDTDGMTCKDIGDITLITKGTLTGVVDRLEHKDLVERWSVEGDGRKTIVALTRQGKRVYQREFPRHIEFLKEKFDDLSAQDRKRAIDALQKIKGLF